MKPDDGEETKSARQLFTALPARLDKDESIKRFIRSQRQYLGAHTAEGLAFRASWDLPVTDAEAAPVAQLPVEESGFDTPILKPRVPEEKESVPPDANRDKSLIKGKEKNSPDYESLQCSSSSATDRKLDKRKNASKSKQIRSSMPKQITLEQMISGKKDIPSDKIHKKRSRSPDPDRDARLAERRERRRAKRAIIDPPKAPSDVVQDSEIDTQSEKARENATNRKKKKKSSKALAGLALMHGFSATNVGTSRLTLKPSTGVFTKGKASAKTSVKKPLQKKPSPTTWSEDKFLNQKKGNIIISSSPSETRSLYSLSESSSSPPAPKRKRRGLTSLIKQKVTHITQEDPSVVSVSEDEGNKSRDANPVDERPKSVTWDIELDLRPSSVSSGQLSRRMEGTVVMDTRAVNWSGQCPVKPADPSVGTTIKNGGLKERLAADSEQGMQMQDTDAIGHALTAPSHIVENISRSPSLAPSQSASQIGRRRPQGCSAQDLLARRSKYFMPTSSQTIMRNIFSQPAQLGTTDSEYHPGMDARRPQEVTEDRPGHYEGPPTRRIAEQQRFAEHDVSHVSLGCVEDEIQSLDVLQPEHSPIAWNMPYRTNAGTISEDKYPVSEIMTLDGPVHVRRDHTSFNHSNFDDYMTTGCHEEDIGASPSGYECALPSDVDAYCDGWPEPAGDDNNWEGMSNLEDVPVVREGEYGHLWLGEGYDIRGEEYEVDLGPTEAEERWNTTEDLNGAELVWEFGSQEIASGEMQSAIEPSNLSDLLSEANSTDNALPDMQRFSQGKALLNGVSKGDVALGTYTKISTVEDDVAKSLKGHWLPQRL